MNGNGKTNKTRLDNTQTMENKTQCLPLETIAGSDGVHKTIAESISTINCRNNSTPKTDASQRWNKYNRLRQLAERAITNNAWIDDIIRFTVGGIIINRGTENTVYLSKDGRSVIKINNLSFLNDDDTQFEYVRDLNYFFNRIIVHNSLFPEIAYKVIGFTAGKNKQVCVVMEQPFIPYAKYPTQQEIDSELAKRDFLKTTLGEGVNHGFIGYTDGNYELTDTKPQNVLIDQNGNWCFIDLDISLSVKF